jgi:4-diphosphocytidyl-2-C-methyl-D-erythritol kinase
VIAPAGEGWSRWPAPAKLNLFLQIIGRRADGYHLLQTVFQLLDWGDTVWLRRRPDGAVSRLAGPPGVVPEQDLAVRAARLLQQATGCALGVEISVDKQIPLGGGFGGGSSDAATVLRALDCLWGTGLGPVRLAELGLQLGADVPLFVHGHSAWAEGVGERLSPIALPPRWYLLLDPGVAVPTASLFQAPDLTRNAAPVRMADFDFERAVGNVFEPVLRRQAPLVDAALTALSRFGPARLTGSGSGCFVAFASRADAQRAADRLRERWRVRVARGLDESPLLQRLREGAPCGAVQRDGSCLPVDGGTM